MLRAFTPALLWLMAIVFLSTMGGVAMPEVDWLQTDKLAHAGAYALLAWLALWGFARWKGEAGMHHGILTVGIAGAVGALLEYVQFRYFPDRHFEYDDMAANVVGALTGWWVFARLFSARHLEALLEHWA
jgi:VanZ family protein